MSELERYQAYRKNPLLWVSDMFGIRTQRIKSEWLSLLEDCRATGDYSRMKLSMFEPFEKMKMLSWQQVEILLAIARAMNGEGKRKIAVRSGHGIGKSSVISIFMIWFLFCFKHSVIWCTAPGKIQMEDVLWKELALWKSRLPEPVAERFDWSKDYVRVGKEEKDRQARYARAKTSTKENSEALAGLHSEYLAIIADEASGVDEKIFEVAMSARTNKNALFIMISNPTRLEGYFYKAFTKTRGSFQTLNFNSEESPLVDESFIEEIIEDYGEDSDQYRVRVKGEFPRAELVDDKGYIPLFNPGEIEFVERGNTDEGEFDTLGIDPSGSGRDYSSFVARNSFVAKRAYRENQSNEKTIAQRTNQLLGFMPKIKDENIFYDNFWVGANVGTELAKLQIFANGVNVGETADDKTLFLNKRAECYRRLKQEIRLWMKLEGDEKQWSDLFMIKYKNTIDGRIKIMPKEEMRKLYGKSPDDADALALTFRRNKPTVRRKKSEEKSEFIDPYTGEKRQRSLSRKTMELW